MNKFASRFNNQPRQSGNDHSPSRIMGGNQSFLRNRSVLDDTHFDDQGDVAPFLYKSKEHDLIAENEYMKRFKPNEPQVEIAALLLNVYGDSVPEANKREL